MGGTGYQPVLSGNLPDNSTRPEAEGAVGKLPTATGRLPVPPENNLMDFSLGLIGQSPNFKF
jgi:hypothetical protein